jgi:hypothetical protein
MRFCISLLAVYVQLRLIFTRLLLFIESQLPRNIYRKWPWWPAANNKLLFLQNHSEESHTEPKKNQQTNKTRNQSHIQQHVNAYNLGYFESFTRKKRKEKKKERKKKEQNSRSLHHKNLQTWWWPVRPKHEVAWNTKSDLHSATGWCSIIRVYCSG